MIYFLRPKGMSGPVRIGCTKMMMRRLAELMPWSPFELEIAGTCAGSFDLERKIHVAFEKQRMHGEWFSHSKPLENFIADVVRGESPWTLLERMKPTPARSIDEIIRAAGGKSGIANASNDKFSPDAVRKWRKNGIPERNWPVVMPLAASSSAELHAANAALRQRNRAMS